MGRPEPPVFLSAGWSSEAGLSYGKAERLPGAGAPVMRVGPAAGRRGVSACTLTSSCWKLQEPALTNSRRPSQAVFLSRKISEKECQFFLLPD